ncbi:hypothetical protein Tco_1555865 [Tanacetum coccineum]
MSIKASVQASSRNLNHLSTGEQRATLDLGFGYETEFDNRRWSIRASVLSRRHRVLCHLESGLIASFLDVTTTWVVIPFLIFIWVGISLPVESSRTGSRRCIRE